VFDSAGVGFQALYVLAQARIFFGELIDFLSQSFVLGALLLPARQAVAAVDHVPSQEKGKENRGYRAQTAAVGEVRGYPPLNVR